MIRRLNCCEPRKMLPICFRCLSASLLRSFFLKAQLQQTNALSLEPRVSGLPRGLQFFLFSEPQSVPKALFLSLFRMLAWEFPGWWWMVFPQVPEGAFPGQALV